MRQLFFLLVSMGLLAGCTKPLAGNAQASSTTPEYSPAMKEAMKGLVSTFDSTEIHQRKGIFYSARKVDYGRLILTEEDKKERIMDGHSIIYVSEPDKSPDALYYRYHIASYFVAGYPEGVWEYYTNTGKLFKRETYRHGKREKVEHVP